MRIGTLTLLFSFCYCFAFSQSVSTLTNPFPGSGGVKIGPDGHIYIGNYGDALPNSNGTQVWRYRIAEDSLELFATGLLGASGNDFDSQGNLFQANIAGNVLSKITPSGQVSTFATGLSAPVGVVVDPQDEIYVCNCGNNTISKIDTSGNVSLFSSGTIFGCPNGITRDPAGNLYVSNFNNGGIIRIDTAGTPSLLATAPGNNNGHLTYSPSDSVLYLASHGASRIYQITLTGTVSVVAGSGIRGNADGGLSTATFSRPNGIAITANGDSIFLNSSIPTSNAGLPLNPSVLRLIEGLNTPVHLNQGFAPLLAEMRVIHPAAGGRPSLELEFAVPTTGTLHLHNLAGQALYQHSLAATRKGETLRHELPLNLPTGLYLASFVMEGQTLQRRVWIGK